MKRYSIILSTIACFLLFCIQAADSQNKYTLKGKVVSLDSKGIKDAIISLPGTSKLVHTDNSGTFTIELDESSKEIECWASGYYLSKQSVLGRDYIEFSMIPENKINYTENLLRPFRSENIDTKSTAINSVGKTGFAEGSTSVEQAIYNALPGLRNLDKSGMPGEGAYTNARGINSFIGNSSPLIVINNIPYIPDMNISHVVNGYSQGVLNALNPNDIQNVTYLRGADAAAYGSLGSAGVILIETENAVDLETRVEFIGQYGLATNVSTYPMMNTDEYKSYIGNIALTKYTDQGDVLKLFPFLKDDPNYYYKFLYNHNTDWQDLIYNTAFVTDNVLKIKGGDAVAKYDLSLGYLNQNGVLKNTDFNRYHMRLNANINVTQRMDLFTSMSMAYMNNKSQEQGMSKETNPLLAAFAKSPLFGAYEEDEFNRQLPIYAKIKDENGNVKENNAVSNPLAIVNTTEIEAQTYDVAFSGGLNFRLTPNWKFAGLIGFYYNYDRSEAFFPGKDDKAIMPLSAGLAENTKRMGIKEILNVYYNLNASWKKKLEGVHDVSASLGWQGMTTKREYDSGSGRNTASDYYRNLKDVTYPDPFYGYLEKWNWMNIYGYASYSYNNLASAGITMAYDAASSSGADADRFYFYPAFNAAVYLKNLPGVRDANWLNRLTLRGEYSVTGNSTYSSTLSSYSYETKTFRGQSGLVRSGISNSGVTPEKTTSGSLGLDISVLNNAIDLTIDVYSNMSNNLILEKLIESYNGAESVYDNTAKIQNRGIEVGLQAYVFKNKDIYALLGGTIAANKNKIKSMGGQGDRIIEFPDGSKLINREGESAYSFYGYKTDGIFASQAEADEAGLTNYAGVPFAAGDVRFVNVDDSNNYISPSDQVILGNASPDFFGRFYASFGYKNFALTANFAYSYGNEAYNAVRREFESMDNFENQLVTATRRWRYDGHVTDMPRAVYGDPMDNNRFSDRYIEDASFIKLKELTLSYNFGKDFIPFLRGGTFYVSGENLFTITKYLGLDPEFSYSYSSMLQGFDYGKVPHPLNVKFGVRLQF